MKYLILIYRNQQSREAWEGFSVAERARGLAVYAQLNADLRASGEYVASEALADSSRARRVRVSPGRLFATDGPFAETKEELAGFFLVDCDSQERAEAVAARLPEAELGLVEVRPTMVYTQMDG